MVLQANGARPLIAGRSPWLRGRVRLPGDAQVGAIALLLAAMARGESVIEHLPDTHDLALLVAALRALGAQCDKRAGRWHIHGLGISGWLEPMLPLALTGRPLDALLIGSVGLLDMPVRFTGYVRHPELEALLSDLQRLGATVELDGSDLTIRGPRFAVPLDLSLESGGLAKAGLLLAGLVVPGTSRVNALPGAGHVERLLRSFGARVDVAATADAERIEIDGLQPLRAQAITLPSDPALAAIPSIAALICPHSEITIEAVLTDPARTGLLALLMEMGGDIDARAPRRLGGEDVADLVVRHSVLHGIEIAAGSAIDAADLPLLAAAASFAEGETLFRTHGETPALFPLLRALQSCGIDSEILPEGMLIRGSGAVPGGSRVQARLDPRLAIAFLLVGMAAAAPVEVDDVGMIEDFFPNFLGLFEGLGGSLVEPAR